MFEQQPLALPRSAKTYTSKTNQAVKGIHISLNIKDVSESGRNVFGYLMLLSSCWRHPIGMEISFQGQQRVVQSGCLVNSNNLDNPLTPMTVVQHSRRKYTVEESGE